MKSRLGTKGKRLDEIIEFAGVDGPGVTARWIDLLVKR